MYVTVENVSKTYPHHGATFHALNDISLEFERGEFICLLGPSGCGKSTLLNLLAGFERPTLGRVTIDGVVVEAPSPKYVTIFQNYNLLPWRTVQKNVELGLESGNLSKKERQERATRYLDLVGLKAFAKNHPQQLSGGMRQRVAFAGALAVEPEIIFMDEPFGALDALTRMEMQDEFLKLQKQQGTTIVFVTHDIEEAVFLADKVVVMTPNPGKIKRVISVNIGEVRDRTSPDFLAIRDRIFGEFELKQKDRTEYFI
ncbi:MAG: ABC transporter ATP-binding protein [Zoogloeaceae bacterium]|jgi:NitT/TauT family transport system ATP-binding protein|nr:ABC transporter ATP-binding protein [Zoogloeaceae bacterium]